MNRLVLRSRIEEVLGQVLDDEEVIQDLTDDLLSEVTKFDMEEFFDETDEEGIETGDELDS